MPQTNKYEAYYQEDPACCGEPFPEIAAFFDAYDKRGARVLDLGCGQGRDALLIARNGHSVLGVDISPTGIRQMIAAAIAEDLDVRGVVEDMTTIDLDEVFDVVVLDRVLHMLPELARSETLKRILPHVDASGTVLIADMPSNKPAIQGVFDEDAHTWKPLLDKKGFLIVRKQG